MKQRLLLLSQLLSFAVTAMWAQSDATQRLVVWLKDGQKIYHDLNDQPETTFSDGMLWLKTEKVSVSYPLTDVLRYTFEGVGNTGIEKLSQESAVAVSKDGNTVTFHYLKANATVSLYAANGTLLEQQKATDSSPLTISVKNRPNGVYIVKSGSQTIKLLKR